MTGDGEKFYKTNILTRKLAAIIFKTNQELSFVYNPIDFTNLIKNPVPMLGLVTDSFKTIKNGMSEIYDTGSGKDAIIGLGKEESDKTPRLYYTSKMIPGVSGIVRLLDIFNDDVQYSKTQQ